MLQTHAVRAGSTDGPAGSSGERTWIHLRSAGVSLLLEVPPAGLPGVRHWGADLGPLEGPDAAASLNALLVGRPDEAPYPIIPGWSAAEGPGLVGSHDGQTTRPAFLDVQTQLVSRPDLAAGLTEQGADTVVVTAECAVTGLCLDVAIQLTATGVVRCRAGLTNRASERFRLDGLRLVLPAGARATHAVDLEASPLELVPLRAGALVAPDRAGRARQVVVAEAGSGYRRGEVWQAHVAFSGAVTHSVEVAGGRTYLGGGERLAPGEVVLAQGEAYHSPWVLWSWGDGLDAAAARMHAEQRAVEPMTVPVIFDATAPAFAGHDVAAMLRLAEYAGAVGVETFLLDLDWCVRAGLDPYADHEARGDTGPHDLAGLLDRVRQFDLDVGLALDLERLAPDPSIARDHPEWLLEARRDGTAELVLDLSVPSAVGYVWERLTKLLDRHPVSVLSWSPVVGVRRPGSAERRHESTLAAYRLLDALRERYPQMIIVSTAVDAAMGRRAMVADGIVDSGQRHTEFGSLVQLLPPERLWQPAYDEPEDGTAPGFRAVAAFFGGLGLGLDLCRQAPASLRAIHRWLTAYKQLRPLLHSGRTVRLDTGQPGLSAHGVVSAKRDEGLFALIWRDRAPGRVRLDGLDPAATYRLEAAGPQPPELSPLTLGWAGGDTSTGSGRDAPSLTGQALETIGIPLPAGRRGSALLLHLTAV